METVVGKASRWNTLRARSAAVVQRLDLLVTGGSDPFAGTAMSLGPGEGLGGEGDVHHQQLKILAIAKRVQRGFCAKGTDIAKACADRLPQQGHCPRRLLLALGGRHARAGRAGQRGVTPGRFEPLLARS